MRTTAALALLVGLVALVACGRDAETVKPEPAPSPGAGPSPASPAPTTTPPRPPGARPASADFVGTGVVEVQGPSIGMQGSHKLVDGTTTVCLLESGVIDLVKHEGKRVKLSGVARTTIEGGKTIVDVRTIEDLP
jgi:hypothetical protein